MFVDGSYTLSILHGSNKLEHTYPGLSDDIFTVIAVNVPLPTESGIIGIPHRNEVLNEPLSTNNNCIVGNEKGDIIFCSKINIRNTEFSPIYQSIKEREQ